MDVFRRSDRAVTSRGLSKSSRRQHVKDDRFNINDRSRYVLGWSNEAKIRALEEELRKMEAEASRITALLNVHRTRVRAQNDLRALLLKLDNYPDFDAIDFASVVTRRQTLQRELAALERRGNELVELETQLARAMTRIAGAEAKQRDLFRKQGSLESEIVRLGNALYKALRTLNAAVPPPADNTVANIAAAYAELALPPQEASETLQKILTKAEDNSDLRAVEQRLNRMIGRRISDRGNLDTALTRKMSSFKHAFPEEAREMDASVGSLPDFRRHFTELKRDKLPNHEEEFRKILQEGTIRGIVGFQSQLETAKRNIADKIEQINEHLRDIDYNPGTYVTITREEVRTEDILEFQTDLKAALSNTYGAEEGDDYNERKFMEVKKLLDRFQGNTDADARWTAKVTDVREWYNFGAEERERGSDESREYFSDSGGKSGGQKEKLAYTILASAIAFQFGLRSGRGTDRSFRFVVIDEAFGRGSDESTRYGLRLFASLNLQLLIVTPLQKINVIEDYINTLHFVSNPGGRDSKVRNLTIEEHRAERARRREENQPVLK